MSASQFMIEHTDKSSSLKLAPPQIVELGRIMNFTDAEKLKTFSWERSIARVSRFFPTMCRCDDAILFLYPG